MHTSITLHLPLPTDAAVRLVNDPEFIRHKATQTGSGAPSVDVTVGADGSFTSAVRRVIPTDQIPAQARSFVGSELEIRQTEAWAEPTEGADGRRFGTVAVEITGAPVRMTGSITLVPAEGGSTMTYEGDIKSPVPLFGASIEKAAAEAIRQALTAEAATASAWVATHPEH